GQGFRIGQIADRGDPAEMSHRAFVFRTENERTFPKTKGAVLLERGHEANDPFVLEERGVPLDRFFHIGTTDVHDFAQSFKDRPGERRSSSNVSVNAWIFTSHSIFSCFHAASATSWQRCRRDAFSGSTSNCECK